MKLSSLFRVKKSRKYPIKRDAKGLSLRARCFELFDQNKRPAEVAQESKIKEATVCRYFRDWKQRGPDFEWHYTYLKSLFNKSSPERDNNVELFAGVWGFPKEQLELILSQPHGLRRLMTRKIQSPSHAEADLKRHRALSLAVLISDFLTKQGGKYEDVYYALQFYMHQRMRYRGQEEADIEEYNKWMQQFHNILAAAVKQEQEGRTKPDVFSKEEQEAIMRYEIQSQFRQLQTIYWKKIAGLRLKGLTEQQARKKMYQDLIDKGNEKQAKIFRQFQDKIHPSDKIVQPPQNSPPTPPGP